MSNPVARPGSILLAVVQKFFEQSIMVGTAAEQREKAAELLRVLEDGFAGANWLSVRKDGGRLIYLDSSHGMGLGWEKEAGSSHC